MKNIKIISAGKTELFDFAEPIGIGLINSAINLTRICLFDKPDYLIFIGTAGSYGKKNIFDIVETTSASNIEQCFVEKNCYTPLDNIISFSNDVSRETIVNSSNYITTNAEVAKKYLKLNIDIENMEFYSVMSVAKEFEIPTLGIFVVTNYCNNNAHEDYITNISKAKDLLIQRLIDKRIIIKEKNG
ncbi:purine nucleoside phosphorylase [Nautilia profundicola AmH]|uniref:Purine nucleoside phosphorylase n=1 Tax=Nautilia profundicola (strain ATCC BAA-1463 / DSM 18972 / AmH) TaxID=598659 RepID=B9L720_NAUPA|nr:purine-nucleoside phosphorylase [Nautilia profundicola]ACM92581.1 purine nucleoside phosphorylase [Nautilia profundicola AmH]